MEAAWRWAVSACSRSVRISLTVRLRCSPVVTASSKAPAMPFRPSPLMAAIILWPARTVASQQIVSGAVRDRSMHQHQRGRGRHLFRSVGLSPPRQDVDHHVIAGGALGEGLRDGGFDRLQAVAQHQGEDAHKAPVRLVARAGGIGHALAPLARPAERIAARPPA